MKRKEETNSSGSDNKRYTTFHSVRAEKLLGLKEKQIEFADPNTRREAEDMRNMDSYDATYCTFKGTDATKCLC